MSEKKKNSKVEVEAVSQGVKGSSQKNTSSSDYPPISIAAFIIAIISIPCVFCGGICCAWMPLISMILGIVGYSQSKSNTGKTDVLSITSIIVSVCALVLLGVVMACGLGMSVFQGLLR